MRGIYILPQAGQNFAMFFSPFIYFFLNIGFVTLAGTCQCITLPLQETKNCHFHQ